MSQCAQLFDIIGGTSTGAIMAAGLGFSENMKKPKYDVGHILDIYKNNAKDIFLQHSSYELYKPSYQAKGRQQVFEREVKDSLMKNSVT